MSEHAETFAFTAENLESAKAIVAK